MIHTKKILRLLSDLVALNLSFFISSYFISSDFAFVIHVQSLTILIVLNLIWFSTLSYSNPLYGQFEYSSFFSETKSVIKNYIKHFITFGIIQFFITKWTLFAAVLFYSAFIFCLITFRFFIKVFLPKFHGIECLNYAIIGYSEHLPQIERALSDNHLNKVNYLGSFGRFIPSGYIKKGEAVSVYEFIKSNNINLLLYASTELSSLELHKLINFSKMNFIDFKIIPNEIEFLSGDIKVELHDGYPLLCVKDKRVNRIRNRIAKRLFDIIVSSLALLFVCSWLFPLIAMLIRLESKGVAFFIQPRMGLKNKLFPCWKFRSMYIDNSHDKHFKATERSDIRVTKIGQFIRKTNLDEFPQIINVFLGDMSIVGPRPQAVAFYQKYSQFVHDLDLRHTVKPGLTGWAQINGLRGDLPDEADNQIRIKNRIEHDIWYIDNWSLGLDIKIILKTAQLMVKGDSNAF